MARTPDGARAILYISAISLCHQGAHQLGVLRRIFQRQVSQQQGLTVEQLGVLLHRGLIPGVYLIN